MQDQIKFKNPPGSAIYIAIIGSREYPNEAAVREFVQKLDPNTVVVSGGARGVDSWAASEARKRGIPVKELKPNYARFGQAAPLIRNKDIVAEVGKVYAFWDGKSPGTMHAVKHARTLGKPVEIFGVSGKTDPV